MGQKRRFVGEFRQAIEANCDKETIFVDLFGDSRGGCINGNQKGVK